MATAFSDGQAQNEGSGYPTELFIGNVDDNFICAICFNVFKEPVELPCQHAFCSLCLQKWISIKNSCPTDRKRFNFTSAIPLSRIAKNFYAQLQMKCMFDDCHFVGNIEKCEQHMRECTKNPNRLVKCSKCEYSIRVGDATSHDCVQYLLGKLQQNQTNFDMIAASYNEVGNLARLGSTGKFYCGKRIGFMCCNNCDGHCGPTNGCNCFACMKLDVIRRRLPTGYLVGREGASARKGITGFFYCGRRVMTGDNTTDGYCGPTDGRNCVACRQLDKCRAYHTINQ